MSILDQICGLEDVDGSFIKLKPLTGKVNNMAHLVKL